MHSGNAPSPHPPAPGSNLGTLEIYSNRSLERIVALDDTRTSKINKRAACLCRTEL